MNNQKLVVAVDSYRLHTSCKLIPLYIAHLAKVGEKMGPKKKKGDGSEDTGKPKNSKLNKMNEMDRVESNSLSLPGPSVH